MSEEKQNPQTQQDNTIRTAATVYRNRLDIFKEIARIKFDKDPVNTAWKEAMELFIEANMDAYLQRYEELKKE